MMRSARYLILAVMAACGGYTVSGPFGAGAGGSGPVGVVGAGGGGSEVCAVVVHPDGDDADRGASWATAKRTVVAGIAEAAETGCEVWVARGTYRPTEDGERTATFALKPGVAVYGGFEGGEQSRDERRPRSNPTILSGDIGVPAVATDNSFHVVTGAEGARLDGFVVQDGYADGPGVDADGAGVFLSEVTMTIANCRIRNNQTAWSGIAKAGAGDGAGIHQTGGDLTLVDSVVQANRTGGSDPGDPEPVAAGLGAGLYAHAGALLTVESSTFRDNRTGDGAPSADSGLGRPGGAGAGVALVETGDVTLRDVIFEGNETGAGGPGTVEGGRGGDGAALAVIAAKGRVAVNACELTDNRTGAGGPGAQVGLAGYGGAVWADATDSGAPVLAVTNSFVENNLASVGGGMYLRGYAITVTNTLVRANVATQWAGGIHFEPKVGASALVNVTVVDNVAQSGNGGGIVTVAIAPGPMDVVLANSIVWGNSAGGIDPQVHLLQPANHDFRVRRSDVAGGCPVAPNVICDENLDVDPSFIDPDQDDYALEPDSPLRDAGDEAALPADWADADRDGDIAEILPVDLAEVQRIVGPNVDVGAYEIP